MSLRNDMEDRKKYLNNITSMVIKIGSSSLASESGGIDIGNLEKFTDEVSEAVSRGIKIIIVTSGAIAAGLQHLDIKGKPREISVLQAAASVGQVELMSIYGNLLTRHGIKIGQILVTQEDTTRREQYLNIKNTISNLMELGIVPVINENDSVAVDEIKFGDNDVLAALVASLIESDLLVILSDVDGLYDRSPSQDGARVVPMVKKVTGEIEQVAGGIGSIYGSGGMASKIKAAKICSYSGIGMVIANSREKVVIGKILDGMDIGTFFVPEKEKKVKSVKRWIAFGMRAKGSVVIDKGAEKAIVKNGKSLLPVGVVKASGNFNRGDTLKVYSMDNQLIAKGISNFSKKELARVKGKKENQVIAELGESTSCEVIHRDCMAVFKS
ncbi:MAG: glutamate 5-kinase [Candidatus Humimicrobiaceae bacterium]